ncbi:MAG: MBL fold metallo-hydrolase [Chitinophagaceae bacterium]|nr:MAG: MBL fold metallo-hydrolase [Chitinophagaceae bacterium]
MRIIPLSEGTFTIDKTKLFVPFDEDEHNLQDRPTGSLLVEVQPFVVVTSKDILLLDTGLGFEKGGGMQLHQNLINAGINLSEITKVLVSHLHKDHAGGVSHEDRLTSRKELSFPRAKYYMQKRELDFAFEKGFPSFITDELEELQESKQVIFLNEDKGVIDGYIHYEITEAHSPFHQVFWIKEEEQIIFFGADDAPQLQQMKHRFVAKYDFNGKKASQLRQQWWERGEKEKWIFLFYHDIKTPVYNFA